MRGEKEAKVGNESENDRTGVQMEERGKGERKLCSKNICGEMEITKFRYRSVDLILLGRSVRGGAFSPMRASAVRTNCLWDTRPPAR